jgi:hypothetical protein
MTLRKMGVEVCEQWLVSPLQLLDSVISHKVDDTRNVFVQRNILKGLLVRCVHPYELGGGTRGGNGATPLPPNGSHIV